MTTEQVEERLRAAFAATANVQFPGDDDRNDAAPSRDGGVAAPRRRWLRPTLIAAAIAGVAVVAVALSGTSHQPKTQATRRTATSTAGGRSSTSCVAPILRADHRRRPPEPGIPTTLGSVMAGSRVIVYGTWYYAGSCNDVLPTGETAQPIRPTASVTLSLITADNRKTTLTSIHPTGKDASFIARLIIPTEVTPGPAIISDGHGHVVELVIHG